MSVPSIEFNPFATRETEALLPAASIESISRTIETGTFAAKEQAAKSLIDIVDSNKICSVDCYEPLFLGLGSAIFTNLSLDLRSAAANSLMNASSNLDINTCLSSPEFIGTISNLCRGLGNIITSTDISSEIKERAALKLMSIVAHKNISSNFSTPLRIELSEKMPILNRIVSETLTENLEETLRVKEMSIRTFSEISVMFQHHLDRTNEFIHIFNEKTLQVKRRFIETLGKSSLLPLKDLSPNFHDTELGILKKQQETFSKPLKNCVVSIQQLEEKINRSFETSLEELQNLQKNFKDFLEGMRISLGSESSSAPITEPIIPVNIQDLREEPDSHATERAEVDTISSIHSSAVSTPDPLLNRRTILQQRMRNRRTEESWQMKKKRARRGR